MVEPTPWDGRNRLLVGLCIALWMVGVGLAAGPARSVLDAARGRAEEAEARQETWERDRAALRLPSPAEQQEWRRLWSHLARRIRPVEGAPQLVARVSEALSAPSVRDLEIVPVEEAPAGETVRRVIAHPWSGETLRVGERHLDVRFRAGFADTLALLERFESRAVPGRIAELGLERDSPGIRVAMQLVWLVRETGEAGEEGKR